MRRVEIDRELTQKLRDLLDRGYLVGDGKTTRPLVLALSKAGVRIQNGYAQDTRKVILALDQRFRLQKIKPRHGFGNLKRAIFEVEEID